MARTDRGTDDRATDKGNVLMVLWPALTLIGFVALTALVVAMGMSSTARYEREQRAARGSSSTSEPVSAARAA